MTTPLALMPAIKDRETAFSYVSRMAAMNGVDTAGFCTDMGLSLTKIINGVPEDLMKLATLCDNDVEDLKRWTPLYFGNRAHTFRGHRVHAKAIKDTTVRGCPVCLREDAEASPDNDTGEMYIRGHWLFRPVSL